MKKVQLVIKILAVALVVAIAFVGIYVQKQNRMENVVKDYSWGMDLKGARVIKLKVSDEKKEITRDKDGKIVKDSDKKDDGDYNTEEKPVNEDEVKNADNYQKSKKIIEKRLKKLGINNYVIKLDQESGDIVLELPENSNTDHTVSNIGETGKFQIVDSEDTEKVLMDNGDIKSSNVLYNTTTSGTVVYLNIEFNKQGKEKLKNISEEYKKIEKSEDSESEESETSENKEASEEKQKEIIMRIDDNDMITTSFDETMENGSIQLSMGQASTDRAKISENIKSSTTIATILDTGNMPVVYETEDNQYIATDITKDLLIKLAIGAGAIVCVALIVMIIKYRKYGLLAAIELIGFIAVYSLLLRYTNVVVTLECMAAVGVIIVMNYIYNWRTLCKIKEYDGEERKKAFKEEYVDFCIKVIPICLLSIVFCFISWEPISSFGMTLFWGLTLAALYNITVAKNFLKQ